MRELDERPVAGNEDEEYSFHITDVPGENPQVERDLHNF